MREVLEGIKSYYLRELQKDLDNIQARGLYCQEAAIRVYQDIFDKLEEFAKIEKGSEPLIRSEYVNSPNNLLDPHSPVVCLLLWIYSFEPPIYAALNEACRTINANNCYLPEH